MQVELNYRECPVCAVPYALPQTLIDERWKKGGSWFCPNGHELVFKATEADRLRKELERAQSCCNTYKARAAGLEEQVEHRERQILGYKGQLGLIRKQRNQQPTG